LLNSEKLKNLLLYLLCSEYQIGRIKLQGLEGLVKLMPKPIKGVRAGRYERKD
jgi:hypothetical protein